MLVSLVNVSSASMMSGENLNNAVGFDLLVKRTLGEDVVKNKTWNQLGEDIQRDITDLLTFFIY